MASGLTKERDEELDREIERYREAATAALDHLEWTVSYLNKIHKPELARGIEKNRMLIMKQMRDG